MQRERAVAAHISPAEEDATQTTAESLTYIRLEVQDHIQKSHCT